MPALMRTEETFYISRSVLSNEKRLIKAEVHTKYKKVLADKIISVITSAEVPFSLNKLVAGI